MPTNEQLSHESIEAKEALKRRILATLDAFWLGVGLATLGIVLWGTLLANSTL